MLLYSVSVWFGKVYKGANLYLQGVRKESPMEMGRSSTGVSGDSVADGVDLMACDERLYVQGEKVWASHKGEWYPAKVYVYLCVLCVCFSVCLE